MARALSVLLGARVRALVSRCGFASQGVAGPGAAGRAPDPDPDWDPEERELQEAERYRPLPGPQPEAAPPAAGRGGPASSLVSAGQVLGSCGTQAPPPLACPPPVQRARPAGLLGPLLAAGAGNSEGWAPPSARRFRLRVAPTRRFCLWFSPPAP